MVMAWLSAALKLRSGHERGDRAVQCLCHPRHVQNAHVAFSAFDLAHVAAIHACGISERLL